MKNWMLKIFVGATAVLNIVFFEYISLFFIYLSDLLWDVFHIPFDIMAVFISIAAIVFFVVFIVYFVRHRDKGVVIPTVEFNAPDGMNPIEVGYLIDSVVDDSDLSALLVYWASKKYIQIIDDKKTQRLKKLVEKLPEISKNYEKVLFNKIFKEDKELTVDKVSERLSVDETVSNVVREVENSVGSKFFDKKLHISSVTLSVSTK